MRVRIIKTSVAAYWYSNHIGQYFEVEEDNGGALKVVGRHRFINRDDCEIVEDFKYGDKVEVWDDETNKREGVFVAFNPEPNTEHKYIVKSEYSSLILYTWKNCKHIPKPKEMTEEEVSKELGYEVKIVKSK